jgi:hypothetical protein
MFEKFEREKSKTECFFQSELFIGVWFHVYKQEERTNELSSARGYNFSSLFNLKVNFINKN